MEPATRRGLLVAFLIAAVGLAACVVRTRPGHHQQHSHVKQKPHKHKKHKKGHDHDD